jgi:hypothetical protein
VNIHDVEQNSPEWLALRAGIPTSSEFSKILTAGGKASEQAEAYMHTLLAEWMLGKPLEDGYTNKWIEAGKEREDEAAVVYELQYDVETAKVGFVTTDDGFIGSSPDRLVGERGLLETKDPKHNTHIAYLLGKGLDDKYRCQLQGQLFVCERDWVDIQSYYPGLPTHVIRVGRDEKYIALQRAALYTFVDRMREARRLLAQRYGIERTA